MIKGTHKKQEFQINVGELTGGSKEIISTFPEISEDSPGPSEGDPDYVLFERLQKKVKGVELVEYVLMELLDGVVY